MSASSKNTLLNLNDVQADQENDVIAAAKEILDRRIYSRGPLLNSPQVAADYLKLQLAEEEHEVFAIMFLDTKHRFLAFEVLFKGTINSSHVHMRQVVKRAMTHNAAGVILSHNHPSGCSIPSRSDIDLTKRIEKALKILDVEIIDHIIIGKGEPYSMNASGFI